MRQVRRVAGATEAAPEGPPAAVANDTARILLVLVLAAVIFYGTLIFIGRQSFFPAVRFGLTFNNVLLHLLQGRFDVDPQVIGFEGFVRNGATYTYFGVVPALLRTPFLALRHFADVDFTALSCLAAAALMALFKVSSLLAVSRSKPSKSRHRLVLFLGITILFGGAQIQFLVPRVYEEALLWANVFAAAFVYLALRGYYDKRGFTGSLLTWLAVVSGLCLLTRVSTALGLYIAFGTLWSFTAWSRRRRIERGALVALIPSASLAVCFAAAAGLINYERFGNIFVFADFQRYLLLTTAYPEWLNLLHQYGEFNVMRMGYGFVYYFFPIWIFHDATGQFLLSQFQQKTICDVELPPSSFLFSDPLLVGLSFYAIIALLKDAGFPRRGVIVGVLVGLLVPILLTMCYSYFSFRYRIEFYPFLEFTTFIGLGRLLRAPLPASEKLVGAAALAGVGSANLLYILYRVSPRGSALLWLAHFGLLGIYGGYALYFLLSIMLVEILLAAQLLFVVFRPVRVARPTDDCPVDRIV